jgi:isopentenyldiphosphate isomerase
MNPADEIVAIVDEKNNLTGSATRREMRVKGLPHRASYVAIFNSRGQIYVQRRTMTKDVYPGLLDPVAGGVVQAGESYEESAVRELAEEMGIHGVPLAPQFDFYFAYGAGKVWGRLFRCQWDGPVVPQPEEVVEVVMLTPEEILAEPSKFTPDGYYAIARLLQS